MVKVISKRIIRWAIAMALIYLGAAAISCYDHLHPPATPGGDPSDYPPLTDSKAGGAGRGGAAGVAGASGAGGAPHAAAFITGGAMAVVDAITPR